MPLDAGSARPVRCSHSTVRAHPSDPLASAWGGTQRQLVGALSASVAGYGRAARVPKVLKQRIEPNIQSCGILTPQRACAC